MIRAGRSGFILASSAALLAAAALGVQLGESAVAEIDPIHFRGAAPPPRAIDPNAVPPPRNAFAQAHGWEAGHAARARDCGGDCDARQARDAMSFALAGPAAARPSGAPYWRDATAATEPAPWAPGETGVKRLSVERYMHYPVEEATAEPGDPAEPAEAGISSGDEESGEDRGRS